MGAVVEIVARVIVGALAFVVGSVLKLFPPRIQLAFAVLLFASFLAGSVFLVVVGDTYQRVVGVVCGAIMLWIVVNGTRMLLTPPERWLSLDADALRRWQLMMGCDVYPWAAVEDIQARANSVSFTDTRYKNDMIAFLFRSGTFIVTKEPEALARRMREAKAAAVSSH